jgi:hypothetical protein
VAGRSGDRGRVEVDDQVPIGAQRRAVHGDESVDVLRRVDRQCHAGGGIEGLDARGLDHDLGGSALAAIGVGAHVGALHEQDVDARRWPMHELLEQPSFASMRTDVTCVEEPPAVSLDEKGVRIERRVVVEERRDPERAELEGAALAQVPTR